MKNILTGLAASVAVLSISAGAFASANLDRVDNGAVYSTGAVQLAQATGGNATTGGTGKNNTIEEQTGKATSDSPGSIDPEDIDPKDTTGSIPQSDTPDNRQKSPMGNDDPSGSTVK
jgi:hypothetical protein